ncbi:paraquat-inducible protein A [Amnimonas aquatica]|uniref:Paraquat-inducible membrane protein A n=1 Tax=Amnimonas aquatica TaxID=2094561 RepID=A0A2P6AQV9_9GAMM|nr:paraquat-inducible protein A [Amnimonas aquatica]PQA32654.1 paraquat-inducible membrane protein A [Amnimonas aquatica]
MTATSRQLGLLSCHVCGLVSRAPAGVRTCHCPRCRALLHCRKPDSLRRTWALLIAAYILYIPANLLPIMETRSLFSVQQDTIMSGIVYLWLDGAVGLALIVFVASIVVPLLKLIVLTLLAASVRWQWRWRPRQRTRLFHLLELIGRWSMLDIFVVALLTAVVQIKSLAAVNAGPGALPFAAVVVLTMLAAMTFDSRLIWDPIADRAEDDDD